MLFKTASSGYSRFPDVRTDFSSEGSFADCQPRVPMAVSVYTFSLSGDELARNVREYAEQEKLNHTMQVALKDFSEKLSAVQDYRESEVGRYASFEVNTFNSLWIIIEFSSSLLEETPQHREDFQLHLQSKYEYSIQ